jgi:hypothetical protein
VVNTTSPAWGKRCIDSSYLNTFSRLLWSHRVKRWLQFLSLIITLKATPQQQGA